MHRTYGAYGCRKPDSSAAWPPAQNRLARYLTDAGEHPRAAALLAGRIAAMPAGPARAAPHLLLANGADFLAEQEHLA